MEVSQKKHKFVPMRNSFFLLYASIIFILLAFIANGIWFSHQVEGLGEAVNLAGSERMRTFQIAFLITRAYNEPSPAREETLGHVRMEMDRFEEILNALKDGSKKYNVRDVTDEEVDVYLKKLILEWEESYKPQLHAIFLSSPENRSRVLSAYGNKVHAFVEHDLDGLVLLLVRKMNHTDRIFMSLRYVLTVGGVVLIGFNLLYLRRRILRPINVLMHDTDEVTKGNYAVRSEVSTPNEIMLLAERFNSMTDAIATSFRTMEETISNRTEELSASNAKMREYFESTRQGIYGIDLNGNCTFINRAGAVTLGYEPGELLGKNMHDAIHHSKPDRSSYPVQECPIFRAFKTGVAAHIDNEWLWRKNGTFLPVEYASYPIIVEGAIKGAVVTFNDISEKVSAEKKMRKLSSAVEQSEDSIVITDVKGTIEYVNPAFERKTGYSVAEAIGNNPRVLKSGRQSKEFYEAMWKTMLSGDVWRGELINKKKNNELYYEQVTISPVKDEKGVITHFVAIKSDITARKTAEQEIERKNRELEQISKYEHTYARIMELFSSAYDEKVILNGALSALAAEQHYPVSAIYLYDDWSGSLHCAASHGTAETLKTEFLLSEGIIGQAAAELKRYVLSGADSDVDLRIDAGIISMMPSAIIAEPIMYQDKIMGVLALASTKNLSEADNNFFSRLSGQIGVALNGLKQYSNLRELSAQLKIKSEEITQKNSMLEESNRLKSEFLANMSHELRTPMNAIIGFSEVLKDGMLGELAEDQKAYVSDIFNSGQHLLSLINDILDLSKIEAGKMTLDLEPVDVPSTLENSLSMVKEKAMTNNIKLTLDVDAGLGIARLDARKFKQIIYNLLSNAVKFTGEGGSVRVTARRVRSSELGVRSEGQESKR